MPTALTEDELRMEWDAALRRAGERACNADHAVYRKLMEAYAEKWEPVPGYWTRLNNYIFRRAGKMAGFPDYEQWLSHRPMEETP